MPLSKVQIIDILKDMVNAEKVKEHTGELEFFDLLKLRYCL